MLRSAAGRAINEGFDTHTSTSVFEYLCPTVYDAAREEIERFASLGGETVVDVIIEENPAEVLAFVESE
jgi:hypothetical protein